MNEFLGILGKTLSAVSFTKLIGSHEDYTHDDEADFDYLPLGGLTLLFDDESVYSIGDYFSTSLGTNGVGIKTLEHFRAWPNAEMDPERWRRVIGKEIEVVKVYWNKETWNNGMKNESYPESIELTFAGQSIFYFCGDVDDYNRKENRYNLLPGQSAGIILYSAESFKKYNLDKVQRVEEITIAT